MYPKDILGLKQSLSSKICIAAHHYQDKNIIDHADLTGDSYRLAVDISRRSEQYIILCGVTFMAEGASLLSRGDQRILMPDPAAGCPMAEMVTASQAETYLQTLNRLSPRKVVPIVYMNTAASLKAVCGKYGGSVCTSSNASDVVQHYMSRGLSVFFLPDQHLGMHTARKLGLSDSDVQLLPQQGLEDRHIHPCTSIYLWNGYCPVHRTFNTADIKTLRNRYRDIKIIVHPEVPSEVALEADESGSTEEMYARILHADAGSIWGVGTESHFVDRVSREGAERHITVIPMAHAACKDMEKTTLSSLTSLLNLILKGDEQQLTSHAVNIDSTTAKDARRAMETMVTITESRS